MTPVLIDTGTPGHYAIGRMRDDGVMEVITGDGRWTDGNTGRIFVGRALARRELAALTRKAELPEKLARIAWDILNYDNDFDGTDRADVWARQQLLAAIEKELSA